MPGRSWHRIPLLIPGPLCLPPFICTWPVTRPRGCSCFVLARLCPEGFHLPLAPWGFWMPCLSLFPLPQCPGRELESPPKPFVSRPSADAALLDSPESDGAGEWGWSFPWSLGRSWTWCSRDLGLCCGGQ